MVELVRDNALSQIQDDLNELLKFFRSYNPEPFHSTVYTVPFRVTRKAWLAARAEGLLMPINRVVPFNEKLITDHYNKKCGGVFYIQIEGRGLFYMNENPMNLPIPPLQSEINVEIRLKRAGSKINKEINEKVAGATLVAVGRLKTDIRSPISLDRQADIEKVFC